MALGLGRGRVCGPDQLSGEKHNGMEYALVEMVNPQLTFELPELFITD
jgi:hypothetical protein